MNLIQEKIVKRKRKYYTEDLTADVWSSIAQEFQKLEQTEISSLSSLKEFIDKIGELGMILMETYAWKYIKMTCQADNPEYVQQFNDFYANVISKVESYDFKFNKKIYQSPYAHQLPKERYGHLLKIIANKIELFREENIPLKVRENELANKYGERFSKLTVQFCGEEKTLTQMAKYQKDADRKVREEAWRLVAARIQQEQAAFDQLFDEMKEIRIQIARNAGFDNYRDYMHQEKGRFDYSPGDLFQFHDSVEKVVVPFLKELNTERKAKLGVSKLRPWDIAVDLDGQVLKPFDNITEFIDKAITVLSKVKGEFGAKLNMMKNTGFLDLENRKGKAPGGYNFPLVEHGAAFIFMNAIGLQSDVSTILHESGHALHSFATANEAIAEYKHTPSEIAELAAMAMELLTLEYLDNYYQDTYHLRKAKREQLEGTLKFLPWCMIVDAFQHWIYTNPDHSASQRTAYFQSLMDRFNTGVDWSGLASEKGAAWLRQLHIFEVPFYYIEYGISQLGAISIYKNYQENGSKAVEQYEEFLRLGYSKSVKELYLAAGIEFDFSEENVREITQFIEKELDGLQ